MIAILKRMRDAFITLSWIGQLVDEKLISSTTARVIEWAIYSFELGLLTYVYNGLESWVFTNFKAALWVLFFGFAKTIAECAVKYFRNKKS